jgi:hypothetical protein
MLVVHHPNQALHDPDTVFRTGQFIPPPDCAERYRIFPDVPRHEGYSIAEAPLGSLAPILANRASARVKEKQGAIEIAREPFAYVSGEDQRQIWLLTREAWLVRCDLARRAG